MTTTNPSSPPCHLWKQLSETILITHILPFLPKHNHNSYPLLETNHDFLSLKRQHQPLQLNEKHSIKYLLDLKGYRERVHRAVDNPRRQLKIRVHYPESKFPFLVPLLSKNTTWEILPLRSIAGLSFISQTRINCHIEHAGNVSIACNHLFFSGFDISSVSLSLFDKSMPVIDKLHLSDSEYLIIHHGRVIIQNLCLAKVDFHSLYDSDISDVTHLVQIPNLEFTRCLKLNDLSQLGKYQKKVSFDSCPLISDVKMFSEVKEFTLRNCPKVTELPYFNQAKSVSLTDYKGGKIQNMASRVSLTSCLLIFDLSFLSRDLLSLDITGCVQIESIPLFPLLQSLTISECYQIKSLPALTNLIFLVVICSKELPSQLNSGLDGLVCLKELSLCYVTHLSYFEDFFSTHPLEKLYSCGTGLSSNKSYSIRHFHYGFNSHIETFMVSFSFLHFEISSCPRLKIIEIKVSIKRLTVRDCCRLTKVVLSSAIKTCLIENCPRLLWIYPTVPVITKNCPELRTPPSWYWYLLMFLIFIMEVLILCLILHLLPKTENNGIARE